MFILGILFRGREMEGVVILIVLPCALSGEVGRREEVARGFSCLNVFEIGGRGFCLEGVVFVIL